MQAEFDYYIEGNADRAIATLNEALKMNPNNYFAFRALLEIYKRKSMINEIESLLLTYPDLNESEFEILVYCRIVKL